MKAASTLFLGTIVTLLVGCTSSMPEGMDGSEDYGKRTLGSRIDDQSIESLARSNIANKDPAFADAHIIAVSFNGVVLLAGQVATMELKDAAADAIKDLRKVRRVHNELTVAGPTSMVARANDAWLTTKIKSGMVARGDVDANRINVTTENGIVYLMGLLTRDEADRAVELTRKTYGVQKIVKVFEYIN